MGIQNHFINTTVSPNEFHLASLAVSGPSFSLDQQRSFIDVTVPDNRLFQKENGEIILIPKTPAEVFGERILRPLIDGVYSWASRFFSGWGESVSSVEGELPEKTVTDSLSSKISSFPTSIIPPSFHLSESGLAKIFFAADRLLTKHMQLLPTASAELQEEKTEHYGPSEPPQSLDEVIEFLRKIRPCQDYSMEVTTENAVQFHEMQKACKKFAKELAHVQFVLVDRTRQYDHMKKDLSDNCLAALKAKKFFKKEKELLESGHNSFFSHPEGEPKAISFLSTRYIQYGLLDGMTLKELPECKAIAAEAENLEEEPYFESCNPNSDRVFSKLRKEAVQAFEAFSSQNIRSADQMQRLFHRDSIKELTDKMEKILRELQREGFVSLEEIMATEAILEGDIVAILRSADVELRDDADCYDHEPLPASSPEPDIFLGRASLIGLIFISAAAALCFQPR